MVNDLPKCRRCGKSISAKHLSVRYCSPRCKNKDHAQAVKDRGRRPVGQHACRFCGREFEISAGQNNKWLCSPACRRGQSAKIAREFHSRRPQSEAIYRARTKAKLPPDRQLQRFYRHNPNAPKACESCGEARVVEIAHRPGHERLGERRSRANMVWPEKVWVLCPTCHRLLDRMGYAPSDLRLA